MHNTMSSSQTESSQLRSQFMTLSSAINFYCSKMLARKQKLDSIASKAQLKSIETFQQNCLHIQQRQVELYIFKQQISLSSVPLAFANPDGSRSVTKKLQLMEIVLSYSEQETMHERSSIPKEETTSYLVDLMALIRSLPGVSDTYRT